jgi:hypothetical protein
MFETMIEAMIEKVIEIQTDAGESLRGPPIIG